jgi:hypothetical protein
MHLHIKRIRRGARSYIISTTNEEISGFVRDIEGENDQTPTMWKKMHSEHKNLYCI